jgi:hypothetical protein
MFSPIFMLGAGVEVGMMQNEKVPAFQALSGGGAPGANYLISNNK